MTLATIAEKLNLPLAEVKKESIKHYLERKLLETETELFVLASKYNTAGIKELDNLIKTGKVHETAETREDFFEIDSLETRRNLLKKIIKS